VTTELDDLLAALAQQRAFLRRTLEGLTDAQAGARPTVSELCLGGLVKHVGATERGWIDFAVRGPEAMASDVDWGAIDWSAPSPEALAAVAAREAEFSMGESDTVEGVLAGYAEVAVETERTVRTLDPNASHELPPAPWFEPGTRWSVRRVLAHVLAETAQHTGHADILREAIDGTKQMG
jgi:hypothetical protein